MLPGRRCLVDFMLFFLALGGSDARQVPALSNVETAAAVFHSITDGLHAGSRVAACVALNDEFGLRDFPPGIVDDVMSKYEGLRPLSACQLDSYHGAYFIRDSRRYVPLIYCGMPRPWDTDSSPPGTIAVSCGIHRANLNGNGSKFEVKRDSMDSVEVTPTALKWIE
jgi:hypothetical protein